MAAGRLSLNDGSAVERYVRDYQYDLAGNILDIHHVGDTRSWHQAKWVSPSSNRCLPQTDLVGAAIAAPESRFDADGNCLYLPHLRSFTWNYRNQLQNAIVIDRGSTGQPDDAEYYVYGADGGRVRKVTERLMSSGELEITEKIYFPGGEIKRRYQGGTATLERTSSHISDSTQRIAVLHQWTLDTHARETDDLSTKKIHYQLSDHHRSASLEIDRRGNVISYEEYFPFGGHLIRRGQTK